MKKIYFILKSILLSVFRFIFIFIDGGETCVVCGKKSNYYPICAKCQKERFSLKNVFDIPRCCHCGRELISTKESCFPCRSDEIKRHSDLCYSLFSYRLWNKELMFLWKQQEVRTLSFFFGNLIGKFLQEKGFKFIIPVPPRPGKISEKGWDQIEELCKILEYFYGIKVFRILKRNTSKQQKKLNRTERLQTIGSAYSLQNQNVIKKELKKNKGVFPSEVCILDDVSTTGATLECCSKLIKEVFETKIIGITIFIVD